MTTEQHHEASMTEALAVLRDRGFDHDVTVPRATDDPVLHCGRCGTDSAPGTWTADGEWRFEGESDPDDMAIAVALTCPSCEAKGVLVASYGPEMPLEVADAVALIPDARPST